ncbi:multidrug effflux MFS transporter [Rhodovulum sp. DZ06]|uniref:multidrug effflux MFS transporter n=1 Tax=Rhodovulum sp. DZ06 TaxID=3425126 RepID=UPI003D33215F
MTALSALMVALGPLAMALYTPAMPAIAADLGAEADLVKMTLTAYFAGFAVAQLVAGPLSDALGRKAVLYWFFGLFLVATLGAIAAQDIHQLIAARAVQGIGASAGIAVSRALVRDLFTGEDSSRIMNGIGLTLAVGPAIAPFIGGMTMQVLPWTAVFVLMLVYAVVAMLLFRTRLVETVTPDPSRFRPRSLSRSYGTLLRSRGFMAATLMVAGTVGTIYAQATLLPFVLIDEVGLTPAQFGISMIAQTGSFFLGSLTVRKLLQTRSARSITPVGLAFVAVGGALNLPHAFGLEPTLVNVLVPVAVYAYGIGFVMPFASTAALAPFPHIAGAASAMTGFSQMFAGLLGGMLGASFADPAVGLGVIAPLMGLSACIGWFAWRALPASETQPPEAVRI